MTSAPDEISVNLQDLVTFLIRGALPALAVAALVGAGMYLWSARQPPVFRAEATLLVLRSTSGFNQFGLTPVMAPPIDLPAYRVAAASDTVLLDALRLVGVESPSLGDVRVLRGRVAVLMEAGARDSSLLRVEGRGETAALAVERSNAVSTALVAWDRRRASESLDRVIATLEQQIEALSEQVRSLQTVGDTGMQSQIDGLVRLRAEQQQQLAYARALVASAEGLLSVLQPADSTPRQVAPRPTSNALVAALLAVVVVYALLLLRAALNTRLRSSEDVARLTGLPVLAEFPSIGRNEATRLYEPANFLRTSLLFATEETHPRVFMVSSSVEHEGKTTVSWHLAEGFARNGYRTLLVDADLRAPSVAKLFSVENPGDATSTEAWLRDPLAKRGVLRLSVEPEGQIDVIAQFESVPNASELLGRGFRSALAKWCNYDVIVIDTPPVLAVSDALVIAPHCTGVLIVVDRHRSDRRRLIAGVGAFERLGVRPLGVVMNQVVASKGSGAGYGSYGTGYGDSGQRLRRPSPTVRVSEMVPPGLEK